MMPRGHDRIADAPYTGVTSATLLGRAHRLSGQVAVADARGRAAVGLARGWMPKPYAYVDPNEDVVACSVADHGHLLIVADGHNGHRASHVALAEVMDTFADAVPELAALGLAALFLGLPPVTGQDQKAPDLTDLRDAVKAATKRGDNVDEVAKALDAVHSLSDEYGGNLGVVHRDVSPANILIGRDGRVRLSDFAGKHVALWFYPEADTPG